MNPNDVLEELGAGCESEVLRMLVEQVPDGVFVKDRQGRFLISNAIYGRAAGARQPDQMAGRTDADCFPEDRAHQSAEADQTVLRTGQALASEQSVVDPATGETRWLKIVRQPLRNRRGKIVGLFGISRDTTVRRREAAEASALRSAKNAELLQERLLLRTVIDNLPDCVYAKDTACRKTLVNLADLKNLRCRTEAEALGKTDLDFFSKEEAARFMADDRAVMETGHPVVNREESFVDDQGRRQWLLTTKLPLRDQEGKIVGLVGLGRNITSLKEAEEARRESEANLQQILRHADCMVWRARVARAGDELKWGRFEVPAAGLYESIFGAPRHSDDSSLWLLVTVPEMPEMNRRCRDAILGGVPGYEQTFRVVQPNRTIWLQERVSITPTGPAELDLVGVVTDVTRQHEAEQKVEMLHRDLMKASRSAGMAEVATGVLHNVGNVLNSVNVAAGVVAERLHSSKADGVTKLARLLQEHAADLPRFLAEDERGRKVPSYLEQLAGHLEQERAELGRELAGLILNVDHIKEIVAMQQSYARIAGVTETVALAELAEDAFKIHGGAYERHGIALKRVFEEVPKVTVDKHKVLQILVNLLQNAKYACDAANRPDRVVTVRIAGAGDGRVRVEVADNGIGIPAENLTRVFSQGFTTRKGGHGFGLHSGALAAKELGGSLAVHSDGAGQGARFTLELPLQPPAAEKQPPAPAAG